MPTVSGVVTDKSGNTAPWSASWAVASGLPGLPPEGKMYYGQSIQGGNPTTFENTNLGGVGVQPFRAYYQGDDTASQIVSSISNHVANGRLVMASIKFPQSWESVAAGADDARMTTVAQGLANLGRPTWVIFHHEPNGDVNSTTQTAADFRGMYARLTPIFRQHAGSKVAIALCLNGEPLDSSPSVASQLIPAAGDYDLFGFDRYNAWATTGGNWRWPEDTLPQLVQWCPPGKRWIIGEYGCRHDPANPQRAVEWLQRHYDWCLANGAAAVSYFNSGANSPDGPWTLDQPRLAKWVELANAPTTHRIP